jgi:hypothetical protein
MIYRQGIRATAGIIFCLLTLFACHAASAADPKRVLMLHSFGRDFKPWSEYAQSIRAELQRQSPWPLDITDHALISARSRMKIRRPVVSTHAFRQTSADLIVSVGAPAAAFVQRRRGGSLPALQWCSRLGSTSSAMTASHRMTLSSRSV